MVVSLGKESKSDGILIDTLVKDGRNLFDFLGEPTLKELVLAAKEAGMSTALSGALQIANLHTLVRINPDIVGVRGAVCTRGDREKGAVDAAAVAVLRDELRQRLTGKVDVYGAVEPVTPQVPT